MPDKGKRVRGKTGIKTSSLSLKTDLLFPVSRIGHFIHKGKFEKEQEKEYKYI